MKLLPKNAASRVFGAFVRLRIPLVSKIARNAFAAYYKLDMDESEFPLKHYRSIGELFIRRLKPGMRPVADSEIVSPVDGVLSQTGVFDEKQELIQAKGKTYTLKDLLRDEEMAMRFEGGVFATIYLAPFNYHRIHSPVKGELVDASYCPGTLWPVNVGSVERVEGLFCINERLTSRLRLEDGSADGRSPAPGRAPFSDWINLVSEGGGPGVLHVVQDGRVDPLRLEIMLGEADAPGVENGLWDGSNEGCSVRMPLLRAGVQRTLPRFRGLFQPLSEGAAGKLLQLSVFQEEPAETDAGITITSYRSLFPKFASFLIQETVDCLSAPIREEVKRRCFILVLRIRKYIAIKSIVFISLQHTSPVKPGVPKVLFDLRKPCPHDIRMKAQ